MTSQFLQKLILILVINLLPFHAIFGHAESTESLSGLSKNIFSTQEYPIDSKNLSSLHELENLLRQTITVNGTNTGSTQTTAVKQGPCQCANGVCGCCSRFLLDTWKQKACINVTYDPDEFSFTTRIWMNDRVLYNRTVSGKNPRPVCIPIPRIPVIRACVRFYNIYFQRRNIHACMNMEGKFQDTIIFKVGLDCIRMGTDGVALVKPEDGGGLGQVEFLPDDAPGDVFDESYDDSDEDNDDDDDDYF